MRNVRRTVCTGFGMACITVSAWAGEGTADTKNPVIRNFSLPEYNEKMELVSKIEGDSAEAVKADTFEITNLRFEMYRNGKVNARVTSPACTFNKRKNEGKSNSEIRITRDGMVVTGEAYQFSGKKEKIVITKNAKVVLRSANLKILRKNDE